MKDKKKNQLTKVNKVNSDNGFKESSIIRKTNHRFLTLLFLASIVIILIFLIAAIIDIYQFGYSLHPYVGYALLAIIILLLLIFVIRPICQALMTPCFTLDITKQDKKKVNNINYRKLKKVAKNLLDNDNISRESKDKITEALKGDRKKLSATLKDIYQHEIKGDITKLTIRRSAETLIATAISQNNKFDALTTIVLNIRLIMQIVVRCGYHPTYPQQAPANRPAETLPPRTHRQKPPAQHGGGAAAPPPRLHSHGAPPPHPSRLSPHLTSRKIAPSAPERHPAHPPEPKTQSSPQPPQKTHVGKQRGDQDAKHSSSSILAQPTRPRKTKGRRLSLLGSRAVLLKPLFSPVASRCRYSPSL